MYYIRKEEKYVFANLRKFEVRKSQKDRVRIWVGTKELGIFVCFKLGITLVFCGLSFRFLNRHREPKPLNILRIFCGFTIDIASHIQEVN
jgi:hypothetical protein